MNAEYVICSDVGRSDLDDRLQQAEEQAAKPRANLSWRPCKARICSLLIRSGRLKSYG